MMVKLLLYAYCVGGPSSRRIEKSTFEGLPFRVLAAEQRPDHAVHPLDLQWKTRGHGVLARHADDLLVMCAPEVEDRRGLAASRTLLPKSGLEPKDARTRLVRLPEGGERFDFLGIPIATCAAAPAARTASRSLLTGPHAGRCSMPATAN
jgi:hypothetical protein